MAREKNVSGLATHANSTLFLVFMAVGCAYIMLAKFKGFPAAAVTFVPVLIMFAYAGCVKFVPRVRLRDDQAGDNLYYLGFLYTLTSLGVSLYQFDANGAGEDIVQNFGVAIGSTITGVALRVVFNQMRQDPADVEQAARLELSEAARRMRRELDASVVELAHFRRSAQQQVTEGFDHVREGMEAVSDRIMASFEEMTAKAAKPLEEASERSALVLSELSGKIGASLDGAAGRLADEHGKLAEGTAQIASALDATATKLAKMQSPDDIIRVRFEPIATSLASTMKGFAEQIARKDEIDRGVIEAMSRSGEQHRKQASTLATLAKAMEKRTEGLETADGSSREIAREMLEVLRSIEADRARTAAADEARDRQSRALAETAAALSAAVASLRDMQFDAELAGAAVTVPVPAPSRPETDDGAPAQPMQAAV